jgi:hypothetical protein
MVCSIVLFGIWYVVCGIWIYMVYGIWYMDVLCYMDVLWYMDVYGTVYGMVFSNTIPKSGNIRYIYK